MSAPQQTLFAPAEPAEAAPASGTARRARRAPAAGKRVQAPPVPDDDDPPAPAPPDPDDEETPTDPSPPDEQAAGPAPPLRTRLHRLKQANLKELYTVLQKTQTAYKERPTLARLQAIIQLQREVREQTVALEKSVGPEDILAAVMTVLNAQTEELLKGISDEFVTLRSQLVRGAEPRKAVNEAFRRVGSRVTEAHHDNRRGLTNVITDTARAGRRWQPGGGGGSKG